MGFLWFNLTPNLYIVFNMLLVSHFDVIPLKDKITSIIKAQIEKGKIKAESPFTENMGIFEYETTLAIVNLIDTVLALTLVTIVYILFRVAAFVTYFIP
jgi:hypothetical protein